LLHTLKVYLEMDISQKTEVFGFGTLRLTTGTTLEILKDQLAQQAQMVQQALPARQA
jgi:CII-binding regulator of phage lambda lysogenization HflD